MSDNQETIGYTYHSSAMGQGILSSFEVLETVSLIDSGFVGLQQIAAVNQRIIRNALSDRFSDTLSLEDIEKTASPLDEEKVKWQAGSLLTSKVARGNEGTPTYFTANTILSNEEVGPISVTTGMSKLKFADGRPHWQRMLDHGNAANLADVGDIYVDPQTLRRFGGVQRRGVGSAMLRTMLDYCPEGMPTIVYEFPKLENGLPTKLEEKGFRAHGSRVVEFCGVRTQMVDYRGPLCGDLIEALETDQPWLTEREPITASSLTRG